MDFNFKYLLAALMIWIVPGCALAAPGNINAWDLPELKVTNNASGVRLLLSDSPEMVYSDGILYQDKVQGDVRLFFHHVNCNSGARQLEVLLENNGPKAARVLVTRHGLGGPGYDWMAVGKAAMTEYLACGKQYQLTIPPGGSLSLAESITEYAVLSNMLINGIFDFVTDNPLTVKVMMLPMYEDSREFSRQAKVLPPDKYRLRGTFEGADRLIIPLKAYEPGIDGAQALTLADNRIDRYLTGVDATDGAKVINYGNYGVVYRIFLPSRNRGNFKCYLTPLGGDYAGRSA